MRALFATIILSLSAFLVSAQNPCLPEGITFTNQEEIDSFQINYPGCTQIDGDVMIDGGWLNPTNITDLYGLNMITSIGGGLSLNACSYLQGLNGLENLNNIGGRLQIGFLGNGGGGTSLISLEGLEGLDSISGGIGIVANGQLTSISALDGLSYLEGHLSIFLNNSLATCQSDWLCEYLSNPNGSIIILDNASGCNSIIEVGSNCNDSIPCLPYGHYWLRSQGDIDNFQNVFPGCTALEGNFTIAPFWLNKSSNSVLGSEIIDLNGLDVITSIGGWLIISENAALTTLTGLDQLTTVEEGLFINSNNTLTNLSGLEGLNSIGGGLYIGWNSSMISLEGLEGVTSIVGELRIEINDALISLSGLEGLTSIGGNLRINHNDILTNLEGLEGLTSIGGALGIHNNDALTTLVGLDNIAATSIDDLKIDENASLSTCEVESVCNYLAAPNGTVTIEDNAPGCNGVEEVEEACLNGNTEHDLVSFTLHPNPSTNGTITITNNNPNNLHLTCFNTFGQQVHQQNIRSAETVINVSTWTPGIYLAVVVEDGKLVGRSKFVVL